MLENRSFDHLLGLSRLTGRDSRTGAPRAADGLDGSESNQAGDLDYRIRTPAPYAMEFDPGHEFDDVLEQLAGEGASYTPGGTYPAIDNSGFAAASVRKVGSDSGLDAGLVMAAFSPEQLPVINALAREFAVCDRWFSSLPGPTWPNRLFLHSATSGGLDDSPTPAQSVGALFEGYRFANGSIFDRLNQAGKEWSVVEGDALPQSLSLGGMVQHAVDGRYIDLPTFLFRLKNPNFANVYTFIEPDYGHILADGRNFKCGNSQHPLDDVTRGEQLLKTVYEAIRSSPHWPESLLIVMYDEHGGFYDHVAPPSGTPPGDAPLAGFSHHGFKFDQLGVRIPALVISPFIEKGLVDHTVYEHSAVPATLEKLFGMPSMTARDAGAASLDQLATLSTPRADAPLTLPSPALSGLPDCEDAAAGDLAGDLEGAGNQLAGHLEPALAGFLHVAIARELQLAASVDRDVDRAIDAERDRLLTAFHGVSSKLDAARLLRDVEKRYNQFRAG
jgi:phospholipase C